MDLGNLGSFWEGSGNDDDNELMITQPDESGGNDLLRAGMLSFQSLVHLKYCKMNSFYHQFKNDNMFDYFIHLGLESNDGNYDCKRQGCWLNSHYELDQDYGFYSKIDSNCSMCKEKCNNDPECGAVECGGDIDDYYGVPICAWWKFDKCTDKNSPGFFTYTPEQYHYGYTCYKGKNKNIYEMQRNFNCIEFGIMN